MSLNKILLIGRLGAEPELKELQGGNSVCNFSLATSESYNDKSGKKVEKTDWHKIVVYGKIAASCHQYLKKGSQCFVEGKSQTRSYDDKNGVRTYITEVIAISVQFLDSKPIVDKTPDASREATNKDFGGTDFSQGDFGKKDFDEIPF